MLRYKPENNHSRHKIKSLPTSKAKIKDTKQNPIEIHLGRYALFELQNEIYCGTISMFDVRIGYVRVKNCIDLNTEESPYQLNLQLRAIKAIYYFCIDTTFKQTEIKLTWQTFIRTWKIARESILIDRIDSRYTDAVSHIQAQEKISIICSMELAGPYTKLVMLTISTASAVFLFDIFNLGSRCTQQFSEIFQNEKPLKIAHDVHKTARLLNNSFEIELNGVFDTKISYNCIHDCIVSIPKCISNTLNMPEKILSYISSDHKVTRHRPFTFDAMNTLSMRAAFLYKTYDFIDVSALPSNFHHLCTEQTNLKHVDLLEYYDWAVTDDE